MSKKLFCGGIPWEAQDDDLSQALSQFGEVTDAKVITDRETGKSRGFGFVTFSSEDDAQDALDAGTINMMGRTVRLSEAQERPRRDGSRHRGGPPRDEPDEHREERGRGRREKRHKDRGGTKRDRW